MALQVDDRRLDDSLNACLEGFGSLDLEDAVDANPGHPNKHRTPDGEQC
jgi:hypothetical protein